MVVREYNDELKYLERLTPHSWKIKKGFQPNMNVRPGGPCVILKKYDVCPGMVYYR